MSMERLWKPRTLLALALLILLAWTLRAAPWQEIVDTLGALSLAQIAALVGLNSVIMLLFSSRWWTILRAQGYRLPYLSLVSYRLAAFSISYFTPGTQFGGEPLQVYLLQSRHSLPGPTALAAVTLDKLFELLANFTFLVIGLILVLNGGLLAGLAHAQALVPIVLLLVIPLFYLLALLGGRFPLTWLLVRLPGPVARKRLAHRIMPLVASTERQISTLFRHRPLAILGALFISGLIWALMLFEYWLTLRFLGLQLGLMQAISALTAARLAFLTPLPAGLGALEASQVFALQALGASAALGISVSLLIRARDLTFGILGLWLAGLYTRQSPLKPLPVEAGD